MRCARSQSVIIQYSQILILTDTPAPQPVLSVLVMKILTVNTGSSSVRLAAFVHDDNRLTEFASIRDDSDAKPQDILKEFAHVHRLADVNLVAHRVVHGGVHLTSPCLIDHDVEREIERLTPLDALTFVARLKSLLPS